MSGIEYSIIEKYIVHAKCLTPLHIGSAVGDKSEVLVHPSDRMPYIQATGLSGVLRTASALINGKTVTEELFGSSDRIDDSASAGSHIRISDGIFDLKTVKMELRPRVRINPETGSVGEAKLSGRGSASGLKFETEYIGAGAEFSFVVYLFGNENKSEFEKVLTYLCNENVQLGGQKSNGCGFISISSILYCKFDLGNEEGRNLWAKEESISSDKYLEIADDLKAKESDRNETKIVIKGRTEGSLLVRGLAVTRYGAEAPDSENIRNSAGDYIVPGSSFKGVLRSRMEYIAGYLKKTSVIKDAFGNEDKRGNLIVKDIIVGEKDCNDKADLQHRIHIDKFTGGVINGGLFTEKPVCGNMTIEICIENRNNYSAVAGITIMAVRDLSIGAMSIGSGFNTGKGFVEVESVEISGPDGRTACMSVKNGIVDQDGLIKQCLDSLKEVEE